MARPPPRDADDADDADADADADADPAFLEVALGQPVVVGSGLGKYTNYTMTTRTTFEFYDRREFSVTRRYNDFARLHRLLQARYRDVVMPALPAAKVSGRFGDKFVRERMSALEDFVNWVALHPIMRADRIVHGFLQLSQDALPASLAAEERARPSNDRERTGSAKPPAGRPASAGGVASGAGAGAGVRVRA